MERNRKRTPQERRRVDERRLIERRQVSEGVPERRAGDRRHVDVGPPERRRLIDRREIEKGPPTGWKDRRRTAERRIPEVRESAFAEWVRLRATRTAGADSKASDLPIPDKLLAHE
ncbi:MAG: hypothetical protein L6Q60_12000 [Rhodocyclaceae bacterium]|jgi:hypothetical protein|nr:hypothetical protein [Rhodocyclaceae bacterium]